MTTQLTKKGWSNKKSGTWSKRRDKVLNQRRGIAQSSREKSYTLAGDDLIKGGATKRNGVSISGELYTQADNDTVIGNSVFQAGIYIEGRINTGRENDTIKASSSMSRGLENQGTISTEDGDDVISGRSDKQEGISNSGFIDMGGGIDTLRGKGILAGVRNDGYISMGKGADLVDALEGGFSGNGFLDMGSGFDTVLGFGEQTVDGGGDRDSLLLNQGRYRIRDNTDAWDYTYGKTITNKGITMVVANFETIGSALSGEEVQLVNGTLLINAMGNVSYL